MFSRQLQDLASAFSKSSQLFLINLQSLSEQLGEQIDCSDERNPVWDPPQDFNVDNFAVSARQTYEAWNVSKRINSELAFFDGGTLEAIAVVFERFDHSSNYPTGVECGSDFRREVDRFGLLRSLRNQVPGDTMPWTPEAEIEARRLIDSRIAKTASALRDLLSIRQEVAQALFRHITGKKKKGHKIE